MEIYTWKPRSKLDDYLANKLRLYRKISSENWKGPTNFGDELGPWIVSRILQNLGVGLTELNFQWPDRTFFSVGSVIQMAKRKDYVWGSGVLSMDFTPKEKGMQFEVFAVRGPLTRDALMSAGYKKPLPEIFGDPAILIPELFPEIKPPNLGDEVLVIQHMDDPPLGKLPDSWSTLKVSENHEKVISRIIGSKAVLTSSLHAKILSDVYSKPVGVYKGRTTSKFKFDDYALGADMRPFEVHSTPYAALDRLELAEAPFSEIRKRLLDSFPIELWREKSLPPKTSGAK